MVTAVNSTVNSTLPATATRRVVSTSASAPATSQAATMGRDALHVGGATTGAVVGGAATLFTAVMALENPGRAVIMGATALGAALFGTLGWHMADRKTKATQAGVIGAVAGGAAGAVPVVVGVMKAAASAAVSDGAAMLWGGVLLAAVGLVAVGLGVVGGKKLGESLGG